MITTNTAASHSIRYEQSFASYLGGAQAFSFWKGRVALYAILKALEIGPGDEVILPGFTCVVVPNAIRLAGAAPVYVDIPDGSYNIHPREIEAQITPRTRAVVVQHTFGIPADVAAARTLADQKGLYLIEDCAHTLGTCLKGRPLGLFGHAAFFSSQWSKPYTTGLGGMAVTSEPQIAARIELVASGFRQPPAAARLRLNVQYQLFQHLFTPRLYWSAQHLLQALGKVGLFVGSSSMSELAGDLPVDHEWRMPSYQQQVGLRQLESFSQALGARAALVDCYESRLSQAGWPLVACPPQTTLLRYPLRVSNKHELLARARQAHIELGTWFETPLHPVPLEEHRVFGFSLGQYPNSEQAAREVVNLPLHERVTSAEAERILTFFLNHARPAG